MALYRPYDGNIITYKQLSHQFNVMYIQCIWVTESNWYVYYTTTEGVDTTHAYVQISMDKKPSKKPRKNLTITDNEEEKWAAACEEKDLPFCKNVDKCGYTARLFKIFENQKWSKVENYTKRWYDPSTWSLPKELKCARLKL